MVLASLKRRIIKSVWIMEPKKRLLRNFFDSSSPREEKLGESKGDGAAVTFHPIIECDVQANNIQCDIQSCTLYPDPQPACF
jgi:hypothetical protein